MTTHHTGGDAATAATPGGEGKLAEARAAILVALDGYRNRRRYSDPPAVFGDTVDALIAAARAVAATAERQRLANMASEEEWDAVRELMNAAHADAIANPDDAVWSDRVVAAQHTLLATLTARRAAAMEEACRAVCENCAAGHVLSYSTEGILDHTVPYGDKPGCYAVACDAWQIRALAAPPATAGEG